MPTSDRGRRNDAVNHPNHYTAGTLETIDSIEAMVGQAGWSPATGYRLGNVLKYIWRHRDKGDPKENLKKALWYLQRELDALAPAEGYAPVKPVDDGPTTPCRVPGCKALPWWGTCWPHVAERTKVEVAKPLEQRSIVVEPLPPEQHNNISAFSRVKHLGEVGTVMALGLEQAEVVFHNGQRRWVPIADLELA